MTYYEDNKDTFILEDDLWGGGKTVLQVLADHASVVRGNIELSFNGGADVLTINHQTNISKLENDIAFM